MDAKTLASFDLFEGFSEDRLAKIIDLFIENRILMGDHLTDKDDYGYSFFLVLSGHVKVSVDGEEVAQLGPGEYFGEVALTTGKKRNATVVATETTYVAKLMTWNFKELAEEYPVFAARLEAKAAERSN